MPLPAIEIDAAVIGAGAAGLAAARNLSRRSLRVVLLEARDRVGGRVWSRSVPGTGSPAELGAEFIHGRGALTLQLLREAGSAPVEVGGEAWTCSEDGALRLDDGSFFSAAGLFEQARTLSVDESVDRFLRRFEHNPAARDTAARARAFAEGFDAVDPADASARAIAEEWLSGVDWSTRRPRGGYGPMFKHLEAAAVAAGADIRLSTVVRRMAWRRGAVAVDAACPGGALAIHARAAIVTVPAGVLRRSDGEAGVTFDPALPSAKIESLRHIAMGQVIRVALWFRTRFWERVHSGRYRRASFFRCEGRTFPAYWTQAPARSEVVAAWVGGPKAVALSGLLEDQLIERALAGFGGLFGDVALARAHFGGGFTHDWGRDPFARGAYSYVTVGGEGAREALAAPVEDTLFFAGEATSTNGQSGTVNGALETGERAAAEAAAALGAHSTRPGAG